MKKILSLVLVLGLLVCTFGINSISAAPVNQAARILAENPDYRVMKTTSGEELILDAEGYIIDEIIVNVDQVLDVDAYNNGEIDNFFGVKITKIDALFEEEWIDTIIEKIGYKFGYLVTIPLGSDIGSAIETLYKNEHILAVSQNSYIETYDSYDSETAATGHYDLIGVDYAWEHGFVGTSSTIVAVIDDGASRHSEFDNNMRFDLAYNATYGTDWDNGNAQNDVTPIDGASHGHKVAGVICADLGDGGVNGICQSISIMPIQYSGKALLLYDSVYHAIVNGAKVINLSYATTNDVVMNLISGTDVLFVTSAGNSGKEIVPTSQTPTSTQVKSAKANDYDNIIVVGNSTVNDTKYQNSNYSATYVDLFAPGVSIPTVNYPSGTINATGTSLAAPVVAAAAALIRSHAYHLSASEVKELILDNVDVVPALANYCVTGGRLAIDKIVNALYAEDRGEYSKGDVTGDGEITSMDKMFAQRIAYGTMTPTDDQFYAADVNKDGVVNTTDVDMILGFYYSTCYFPPI